MGEPSERPRIYFDHAATTPVRREAALAMESYSSERFGNPSSLHAEGRAAREALERSRASILRACGASAFDLVFTSGGTEADNLAIAGAFLAARRRGVPVERARVVTSAVEHPAVHGALGLVEALQGRTVVAGVDRDGRVDPDEIESLLVEGAALVSLMGANNETGVLEPIEAVGRAARERGALFHSDLVQVAGKRPLSLDALPLDLATVSSHKVHGPRGIAALFVRKGTALEPLLRGGSQEAGLRPGTEDVAAAVGFAAALELAVAESEAVMSRLERLRDRLRVEVLRRFPDAIANTPAAGALPTILNVSFPGVEGESLVRLLDAHGVAASTGSACNVGSKKPSHVLRAMGRSDREVRGSLRISLGRGNTEEDVEPFLAALEASVGQLERIAPGG